jgi:hypothetical protein
MQEHNVKRQEHNVKMQEHNDPLVSSNYFALLKCNDMLTHLSWLMDV